MAITSYQIRFCPSCGLRYPLTRDHPFGERCPSCLGETVIVLEKAIEREPTRESGTEAREINLNVLLDNVRSAWNVGSIFRSADGFEFRHAYLCGITPTPENAEVRKTALGADEFVSWSYHRNAVELIKELKEQGSTIWALEQTEHSVRLTDKATLPKNSKGLILVAGNEVTGVDPGILELSDQVVHLPMRGQKRSFNVAVAFAIAAQILHSKF